MALLKLVFEVSGKSLVCGVTDQTPYALPPFRQEETPTYDITMVRRYRQSSPFFEKVSFGGWTAYAAIGTAGSVLASGTSSSLSSDNFTFQDLSLPLNTAGINALTDAQTGIYFELRFTDTSTGNYFGRRFLASVEKAIATAGATITATTDRALTVAEAQLGYVRRRMGAGDSIEFVSPDGTKTGVMYLDNDGAFHLPGPAL